jgi:hypothetical protein
MVRTALKISALLVVLCAAPLSAKAGPTCDISEDKKRIILALLCGQMAKEREYRFEGPNCVINSVRVRFRDTAIQILGLKMCGDDDLSNRLKEANLRALKFFETLSICTAERPSLANLMDESVAQVSRDIAGERCTPEMRSIFLQQRSRFEQQIQMSLDPNINAVVYEKLGIKADETGNIRDR